MKSSIVVTLISLCLCAGAFSQSIWSNNADTTNGITFTTWTNRNPVQSTFKAEGSGAFFLAHPTPPTDESIQPNVIITPSQATKVFFESMLGYATPTQIAKLEVSTNNGASWAAIWSRPGTWSSTNTQTSDNTFKLVTVPLNQYSGIPIRLRFFYDYTGGSYFPDYGPPYGWLIDNIQIGDSLIKRLSLRAGDPTPDEIIMLEYINRARKDTIAEGLRLSSTGNPTITATLNYYQTDLSLMRSQFATLSNNLPPLAMNSKLIAAARLHSQDMFNNAFQGHVSSTNPPAPNQPNDDILTRITRQGYQLSTVAENVYAFGTDAFVSHAGFNIDWGVGPGGMQTPPGHRLNIHSPALTEAGIGVVNGTKTIGATTVGPFIVTQILAPQKEAQALYSQVSPTET